MFFKRMIGLVALACMGACSETPVAPPSEKPQPYQFPQVAQNPTSPFAAPVVVPTGPRVEVYSHGVLKQVFSAAGSAAVTLPKRPADLQLPDNFKELLDGLARKPVNQRTAHFVEVMRTLANVPAAARGKAIEAVSKQLLRETEHKDYPQPDGSRVLEYYFDHQLATRVVLAPNSATGQRRFSGAHVAIETPVGRETVSDPDGTTCTDCYDPAYDAMLWATITWYADQLQAMVDVEAGDPDMITFEKLCLGPIGGWILAVGTTGALIGSTAEGWGNLTRYDKLGRVSGIAGGLAGAVTAWNAMHNCFHS